MNTAVRPTRTEANLQRIFDHAKRAATRDNPQATFDFFKRSINRLNLPPEEHDAAARKLAVILETTRP